MKFEIRKSRKRLRQCFYVRIVASNGECLFTSEMYARKEDALAAANRVIRNATDHGHIEDLT